MDTPLPYILAAIACLFLLLDKWLDRTTPTLNHIPSIGPNGRYTSFVSAIRFIFNARSMVQRGVSQFKSGIFKVPTLGQWFVVVTTPQLIEDLRRAKESDLSFYEAINDGLAAEYTLGQKQGPGQYHTQTVKTTMTRNIEACYSDVYDEIKVAFEEEIACKDTEWTRVHASKTMMQIVCRASNRMFVGLPLCRDAAYCELNKNFTVKIVLAAMIVNVIPAFLHPIAGPLLSPLASSLRSQKHGLEKLIRQRKADDVSFGKDRSDRPNDLITWLLDAAPENEPVKELMIRILGVNFGAIHTSTMMFTQALYDLAGRPEYIDALREDAERAVQHSGWTKAGIARMSKIDSFLRESGRMTGLGCLNMGRKVMQPEGYTFSDGTTIPQGAVVFAAPYAMQHADEFHPEADTFNGFRFVGGDDDSDVVESKSQFINTSCDFLLFGHGKHACPGRFFAANELKTMLAHVVLNYDVKLETEQIPQPMWVNQNCVPDPKAHVLFRKREPRK